MKKHQDQKIKTANRIVKGTRKQAPAASPCTVVYLA